MTLLFGVLAASLLGSLHCAAMCGPLVCTWASQLSGAPTARAHLAYHIGRLLSYTMLGAAAGAVGAGVNQIGTVAGVSRAAAIFSAALMIVWALAGIARTSGSGVTFAPFSWAPSLIGGALMKVRDASPPVRAGATGLLTTLIPCGWLYVFVVVSAGTGAPLSGSAVMLFFWIGTVPSLTVVALGARMISPAMARRIPVVGSTIILIIALLTIFGRLHPGHVHAAQEQRAPDEHEHR